MDKIDIVRRISSWAGWVALAFVAFVTVSPIQDRPVMTNIHVEHFGAYAVIGFLLMIAYPRHRLLVVVLLIGAASLLEIGQLFVPGRHGRILDAAVKIGGASFGVALAVLADKWLLATRKRAVEPLTPE